MLELRSISKRLGSFALTELSAEIQRGEYFVLVGPSGVGKTVLLEIIAGLIPVDGGQVLWCGGEITHVTPERRHFALVYQDYALFEHLSVARNIAYGLAARGVRRTHAVARVHVLAERLGIESLLGRRVESLSGGEQQRVALARALGDRTANPPAGRAPCRPGRQPPAQPPCRVETVAKRTWRNLHSRHA